MSVTNLPVSRIMSKEVVTISLPGTREKLLEAIRTHKYSMFPVTDENGFRGIVGRHQILRNPRETQLSMLTSSKVPVGKKNDSVYEIAKKMLETHYSKVPILDDRKQIIGIVSISDIIWQIVPATKIDKLTADYFSDSITVIWEGTPANVAVHILAHSGYEALPVIDDSSLVGILSDNDLLKFADVRTSQTTSQSSESESPEWEPASILIVLEKILTIPPRPVKEVCTREVIKAYKFTTIKEAAVKLRDKNIDQLPVVDEEDNLLGMLSNWHILQAFLDSVETP